MEIGKFFNKNDKFYGSLKAYKYDYFFINFISKKSKECDLLDIGGGGGCFIKLCKENFQKSKLCIIDPSNSLLYKQEIDGVKLVIGKLPYELNIDEKYDFIHVKEVLHHVTGNSISESKFLLRESLINSQHLLNNGGYLLIHELFYESYFYSTLTRNLIFYLLKLQNILRIQIPVKSCLMDLDVCFYTRKELKEMFEDLGFNIIEYYEENWANTKLKKIGLLKNWGRMCFILQKSEI